MRAQRLTDLLATAVEAHLVTGGQANVLNLDFASPKQAGERGFEQAGIAAVSARQFRHLCAEFVEVDPLLVGVQGLMDQGVVALLPVGQCLWGVVQVHLEVPADGLELACLDQFVEALSEAVDAGPGKRQILLDPQPGFLERDAAGAQLFQEGVRCLNHMYPVFNSFETVSVSNWSFFKNDLLERKFLL